MKLQKLEDCHSLDQVVQLINDDIQELTPENYAARYAWDAAKNNGYGFSLEQFEVHLDTLVKAGAKFNYQWALEAICGWIEAVSPEEQEIATRNI